MKDLVQFVEALFIRNFHDKKVSSIKSNIFWDLKILLRNKNKKNI